MSIEEQSVSVIITSIGNIEYIKRSLNTVYNQSFKNIEIIVVLDKSNPEILRFLEKEKKKHLNLNIIVNKKNLGGNESRNIGIRESKCKWIALLDDDDEWEVKKIEYQLLDILRIISDKEYDNVVSCTRLNLFNETTGTIKKIPKKIYNNNSDLANFLFGLKYGTNIGAIQTSSILASRELFLKVPFEKNLPKHQDWDWLMKVAYFHNGYISQLPNSYTKYYVNTGKGNVSGTNNWDSSLEWIKKYKNVISNNAYESFLMSVVIKGIISDKKLTKIKKKQKIKYLRKEISLKNKISIFSFRLRLLYITEIFVGE